MKVIFLCFALLVGCNSTEVVYRYSCNQKNNPKELLKTARKEIEIYYLTTEKGKMHIKKIIKFECVNDSIIEVEVMNSYKIYGYFVFDSNMKIKDVEHAFSRFEIPPTLSH